MCLQHKTVPEGHRHEAVAERNTSIFSSGACMCQQGGPEPCARALFLALVDLTAFSTSALERSRLQSTAKVSVNQRQVTELPQHDNASLLRMRMRAGRVDCCRCMQQCHVRREGLQRTAAGRPRRRSRPGRWAGPRRRPAPLPARAWQPAAPPRAPPPVRAGATRGKAPSGGCAHARSEASSCGSVTNALPGMQLCLALRRCLVRLTSEKLRCLALWS